MKRAIWLLLLSKAFGSVVQLFEQLDLSLEHLSRVQKFLAGFHADISIFNSEEALGKLEQLNIGPMLVAKLYLLTRKNTSEKIAVICKTFLAQTIKEMESNNVVVFAFNCYYEGCREAVSFILMKNLLSRSVKFCLMLLISCTNA